MCINIRYTAKTFDITENIFAFGVLSCLRRCQKKEELEVVNIFKKKILPTDDRISYKNFYELIITTTFKVADKTVV